jgi:hypothetical protein
VKQLLFVMAIVILSAGCKGPLSSPASKGTKNGEHKVVVEEVLQVGSYTYLNVSEKRKKSWLAVPTMQVVKGDKLYYNGGLEMTNFFSKELNRTFSSVIFLEGISREPEQSRMAGLQNSKHVGVVKTGKLNITIKPGEGCITIGKLFENKAEFSGKSIRVRGKVTKFNPAIMGKNWIHIQDGTDFNENFDLTITTNEQLTVGDTATD